MRYTGRKGWQASVEDTWSLDYCLSPIILAGLTKFKEVITSKDSVKGVPSEYATWGAEGERDDQEFEDAFNKWVDDIDKMIYAFNLDNHTLFSDDANTDKVQEGLNLFAKHYHSLWW